MRHRWPGEARPAFEEASTIAIKEAVAWQVQQAMLKNNIAKVEMARRWIVCSISEMEPSHCRRYRGQPAPSGADSASNLFRIEFS
ncbi:MAG: hypothetical protein ACYCPD_15200, partial [Acidobacteriaceae bacterium]